MTQLIYSKGYKHWGILDKDSLGNYPKAIVYLDSVLQIDSTSVQTHRLKVYATYLLGNKKKALSIIEVALILDSKDFENYITRAKCPYLATASSQYLAGTL